MDSYAAHKYSVQSSTAFWRVCDDITILLWKYDYQSVE